ncbi:MAG: glycosyltransferase [Oligoflexia bacterium]|nr:glycosyltransferase [Oligoflexia bacterium]
MKIALFHDSLLPPKNYGGIERIVVTLSEEYVRLGHDVWVVCRAGSKLSEPVKVIEIPKNWNGKNIEDIIPSEIEFIHSHQPLVVEPKRPYLVTIHGNGHLKEKYLANTNFLSQSHAKNHNSKIFVFNGVDPKRYNFLDQKEDYYLFLAKTTWRVKNLKTALNFAKDLKVKLKIIGGNGPSNEFVEYLGFVDDKIKNQVLSKAKALIYPTNWDEPCAAAPLEALACGTPVIATKNGCMPEMVEDGITGVLCDNYSQLLAAPEKLKTVSYTKCRQNVEQYFSVQRMAEDYLSLFGEIIKKGKLVSETDLPRYNFKKESVKYLFKPTIKNKLQFSLLGKI